MRLGQLLYFVRQALLNISHNRLIHVISLGTISIAVLILGGFILLLVNVEGWIKNWGGSITMSVYLEENLSKGEVARIKNALSSREEMEIYRYISKEEALRELERALGPQAQLISGLTKNPLPASFEIVVKEAQKDPELIKKEVESIPGVVEVQYSEAWIKRFKGVMRMVRIGGVIVGILLCLGILFIVTNTIKLAIYSRKEEIEIMKLVGATDWFVKAPFLIEGLIQGMAGGLLALLGLFIYYLVIESNKGIFLSLIRMEMVFLPYSYVVAIVALSGFLGLLGSFLAVGRFFEV